MLGGLCEGDDSRCSWPSDSYGGRVNVEHFKAQENRTEQTRLAEYDALKNGNQQEKIVVRLRSNNSALAQRDVSFTAVSRAPLSKIDAFKKRMGWRFAWVSSYGTDFNSAYRASFTEDEIAQGKVAYNFDLVEFPSAEAPGISVFYKDNNGNIFHTYSAYARGTENVVNTKTISTSFPKAAMRKNCHSRWHGFAITIATRVVT
jgi:Bacterial protein of unknown function (DUF899)